MHIKLFAMNSYITYSQRLTKPITKNRPIHMANDIVENNIAILSWILNMTFFTLFNIPYWQFAKLLCYIPWMLHMAMFLLFLTQHICICLEGQVVHHQMSNNEGLLTLYNSLWLNAKFKNVILHILPSSLGMLLHHTKFQDCSRCTLQFAIWLSDTIFK